MAKGADGIYALGFAEDAHTERALREGLVGRAVMIRRVKHRTAIQALATGPSAKVVIIDIGGKDEPAAVARELRAVCAFDTHLVAIGTTDNADFVRNLMRNGIQDYLVKPVSSVFIRETIEVLQSDTGERSYAGRVLAFMGSSGCGTSSLVAAIARCLAGDDQEIAVVDVDPVCGKLPDLLNTEPTAGLGGLLDMLEQSGIGSGEPCRLEPAEITECLDAARATAAEKIALFGYATSGPAAIAPSPLAVGFLLQQLANRSHVVLACGAADPDVRLEMMQGADARVLVYEPTLSSIRMAVRYLALLGSEYPVTLVQNHSRSPKSSLSSVHVRYALAERRPDVVVPFEPSLCAANEGKNPAGPARYRRAVTQIIERVMAIPMRVAK